MSENRNTQDAFKTILNAGLSALTGGEHDAKELVDHVLENVQIPDELKGTVEQLAEKGESMLKGLNLSGVLSSLTGDAQQAGQKVEQQAQQAEQKVASAAESVGDEAHSAVMGALEQLNHGQLTQVLGKAAGLISSLTQSK